MANAKEKTISMERVLDKRENAIKEKVATLRKAFGKNDGQFDAWASDITYVGGFGDIGSRTSRCTIWVNTRAVYIDYGNTSMYFKACEDFAKSHSDKVAYSTKGIATKAEKRFTTDMDTATDLIKALVKVKTTGKAKAKDKATDRASEVVKGA